MIKNDELLQNYDRSTLNIKKTKKYFYKFFFDKQL